MILPVSGGLAYPYIMSIAFSAVYLAKGGDQHEGRAIGDYFGLILYIAQVVSMISFGLIAIYKNRTNSSRFYTIVTYLQSYDSKVLPFY